MNTSDKAKEQKEREHHTPIIDGDARPDINLEPKEKVKKGAHPIPIPEDESKKEKFTRNRVDTNSLEDFRDAKQE